MTRHSKNNTALGVFTYAEKQKLKGVYGTLQSRMGKDSQKPFDSCSLCLADARNPLVCGDGHLFCKECIFNSIVKQRKDIEVEQKALEVHRHQVEQKKELLIQEEEDRKVLNFIQTEVGVTSTTAVAAAFDQKIDGSQSSSFKIAKEKGSFWMPEKPKEELVEKDNNTKVPILSKSAPQCNVGKEPHPISLKKLVEVKFNEVDGKKSCFVCVKGFGSGVEICILKTCGHAICKGCTTKFVSVNPSSKTSSKKETLAAGGAGGKCPVCEAKIKTEKQIISLDIAGTGFSAKGQAEAKRETLAFQC